jgi:hypothetical protein
MLHDSRQGLFKLGRTQPRSAICVAQASVQAGLLNPGAVTRQANPPIAQGDYWPTRLLAPGEQTAMDIYAAQRWNATGLYLEAGVRYRFTASGEWLDGTAKFSPAGGEAGRPHLSDVARLASTALGSLENTFNSLANSSSDFWFTRRVESAPWLALIGFAANGTGEDLGETFAVGEDCDFTPATSGYLYAYANDAWQAYANNHGSVQLTVARE